MRKYVIILIGLALAAGITAFTFSSSEKRTGYVDNGKLYKEFLLKKELESKFKNIQSARQSSLDSIALGIRSLEKGLQQGETGQMEMMQREYMIRSKQFEEENQRLAAEYEDQIWTQLNQYVQDYGKQNGYTFIYGTTANGSLMYADESYDLTKELVEYSNNKFRGE